MRSTDEERQAHAARAQKRRDKKKRDKQRKKERRAAEEAAANADTATTTAPTCDGSQPEPEWCDAGDGGIALRDRELPDQSATLSFEALLSQMKAEDAGSPVETTVSQSAGAQQTSRDAYLQPDT